MLEKIIVFLIVAAAVLHFVWRSRKSLKSSESGEGCGCSGGCGSCNVAASSCDPSKKV
ncbi:MAG: hypothetical protein B6245_19705 [Desulfobacteraceae bacterium 4572_88]|nr:MAG: hypothetical protein B6245_19705 [Desulfobacteraceae bacterium 4572_88]